jgi:hypothetical protein
MYNYTVMSVFINLFFTSKPHDENNKDEFLYVATSSGWNVNVSASYLISLPFKVTSG